MYERREKSVKVDKSLQLSSSYYQQFLLRVVMIIKTKENINVNSSNTELPI